jgi:hypothetical protein
MSHKNILSGSYKKLKGTLLPKSNRSRFSRSFAWPFAQFNKALG